MLTIEQPGNYRIALLHLGFRPFFLLAGLYAVVSTLVWMWVYHAPATGPALPLTPTLWHSHEMVYGYAMAVVAGFLLTAVRNWTGVQTVNGVPLLLMALCWLGARVLALVAHPSALAGMAVLDMLFGLALVAAVAHPVIKARQWGQAGVVAIPVLLALAHGLFYAGALGWLVQGAQAGLYLALYLLVLLIFVMGRRVVPFFITKGVGEPVNIPDRPWLDQAILVSLGAFIAVDVFLAQPTLSAALALVAFVLQAIRLRDWHVPGIWRKPLLWSLYLAFAWIALAFGLKAASLVMPLNPFLSTHAIAYGGVGLVTLGMMCRVSLGHTGRNVFDPPAAVGWMLAVLVAGAVVRVLLPLVWPAQYALWIGTSQALWIIAFALFAGTYAAMLVRPRIDGSYG
jgi:uncharacterized protein involved in response to NO